MDTKTRLSFSFKLTLSTFDSSRRGWCWPWTFEGQFCGIPRTWPRSPRAPRVNRNWWVSLNCRTRTEGCQRTAPHGPRWPSSWQQPPCPASRTESSVNGCWSLGRPQWGWAEGCLEARTLGRIWIHTESVSSDSNFFLRLPWRTRLWIQTGFWFLPIFGCQ